MKKKLKDIVLKKDGWKLTPKSISILAEKKDKTALNSAVVGIKEELKTNSDVFVDIKNNISELNKVIKNKTFDVDKTKEILLGKEDVKKKWKFIVLRNPSREITEIIAEQI